METTFITIHDLTREARVLYSSDSIVDILGHTPDEVVGKSCWDFFHPDEIPFAKDFHSRGVKLDKAAVLAYCQIRNREGDWVGCECCFSVVYDVMVCCTSIYRRGMTSQKRAVEAPIVRKLFSSSPKDPRYHMLSHLSAKFNLGPTQQTHEPRAALFLNRFTRTLTVMYATSGIEQVIGIPSEEMKGKSFYYCIQENCLEDAVRVLETAKGNDSIAYLRFHFRDPRVRPNRDAPSASEDEGTDEIMTDVTEDEDEGGVDVPEGSANTPPGLTTHNSTSTSGIDTDNPSTSNDEGRTSSNESGVPRAGDARVIRDVAVFAWALTGINGSLTDYSRGKPVGESQPPEGFPIWHPQGNGDAVRAGSGSSGSSMSGIAKDPFGDPGLDGKRFGA
ncbi:putative potassium voltage-dependent transporter protein [Neofusicoccum parvum UCRNP2]|uniref:Putative potassium voltage-dependent transporter protein n=1 Tax=Botryosphaeria parva (strain UCR-NP2) TaxID=1287680 RepID=R1FWM4_BOTPV|nr:putative potassium voltage-dependent transporter protein [Neofusicoccum parvum UCRNP2]